MTDLNALLLKLTLVAITSPAWWPFLKAVWEELNEAMADEGGLFGRPPTARELEQIERARVDREDPLVHEPWPSAEDRLAGRRRLGSGSQDSANQRRPQARGTGPGRPAGFR